MLGSESPNIRTTGTELSRALARHGDDDFALRVPLFRICHRFERLVERERAIEYRSQGARIIESGQRLQLLAIGPHDEEGVAHA